MGLNDNPVKMPELNLIPETERGIDLDKGMKQVLSLLSAYCQEKRVALRASPSGVLFVASSQIQDIIHKTAAGSPVNMVGDDIACTEVLCMGHPSNTGTVWVRPNVPATVNNAWPLATSEAVILTIDNLSKLNFLMSVGSEKLIIAYSA